MLLVLGIIVFKIRTCQFQIELFVQINIREVSCKFQLYCLPIPHTGTRLGYYCPCCKFQILMVYLFCSVLGLELSEVKTLIHNSQHYFYLMICWCIYLLILLWIKFWDAICICHFEKLEICHLTYFFRNAVWICSWDELRGTMAGFSSEF